MGFEEPVDKELEALVRKAIEKDERGLRSYELVKAELNAWFSDKIHSPLAFWFASNPNRIRNEFTFSLPKAADNPAVKETRALDRLKTLAHFIYELYNTGGANERLRTLYDKKVGGSKKHDPLPGEDLNLLLPIFHMLSHPPNRERFFSELKQKEASIHRNWLKFDSPFELLEKEKERFNGVIDGRLYFDGPEYIGFLDESLQAAKKISVHNRPTLANIREEFNVLIDQIQTEHVGFVRDTYRHVRLDKLRVYLNAPKISCDTGVMCCISGFGKSKEASVLYALDRTVNVWSFQFADEVNMNYEQTFGMAIFVKARGHHFSKTDPENYLVLEGFPANQRYYDVVGTPKGEYKRLEKADYSFENLGKLDLTLSQMVYILGLKTAKQLGIPKLFVNASHSDRQKSVHDAMRIAAIESGLPHREVWERGSHRTFKLLKDPSTEKDFQVFEDPGTNEVLLYKENKDEERKSFEYTHFIEKRPLPSSLVKMIRHDPGWNGESVFDTWYEWNRFIMDTHKQWSDELKAKHPYAKAIYERGRDPQWNLGIGYCKGFEVDVEKECKRLGIS